MDDSSSSSSSHQLQYTYDVFLSFRGEDTRKGFTDNLCKALKQAGIHTFRDDDEIPRGTQIQQQLEKAIQESRVSVVVFSKDYASSRWCLDELVKISQRAKTDGRHIIIPVFYHVDPYDVQKQTGSFAEAFSRHEQRFKEEMAKVEGWRRALSEVPDLAGMVLGDRYESEFIQDLVEEIGKKLDRKALYVAPYVVGIDRRVRDINEWLKDASDDVGIAVICGMGGIGKTTIAKTAYNQNFDRFEGSSFLADVREVSKQPKGRLHLLRQLLWDIQKRKTEKLYSLDEGIEKIKHVVSCKRVLIVVDDVDNLDQLRPVLGERKWFHPRSKIIITTRNEHLLKGHEVMYDMFTVDALYELESLELFSWYAFKQANPIEGFMELSTTLVQRCEGLPLALQVLGSSLSGQSVEIWQDALQNLDVITEGKIGKVLRISFDSLHVRDQSLFLYLACFFIRKDKYFITTVLDNCGFSTRIELQNLIHRCLVRFNERNELVMHELLRDMGMEIIRKECPEDSGKRSRVLYKDAINVLRKLTGTETIKGLKLMEDESSKTTFRSIKKRCNIEDYEGNSSKRRRVLDIFSWQPINFFSKSSASVSDEIGFKTEAFTRMNNLEILVLSNVKFRGSYEHFPQNLIWLCWSGFPEESLPENFSLSYVVALDLENSSLRHVWKRTAFLPKLKILNLSHSHHLMTTPDFSLLPNLESLILEACLNLVEVDESIGELDKLVFLNLKDCKNLMKLPRLQSLQTLILSGCSEHIQHQLQATATCTKKVSMISPNSWQSICPWVLSRKNVELNSLSFANFSNCLSSLCLANCNLSVISNGVCFLSSLMHLDLSENPMISLPENMNCLIMLETLDIDYCTKLRTLPRLPPSLNGLYAYSCRSLKRIANLPNISTTLRLHVWDCGEIDEVEGLFMIKPLRSIGEKMKQLLPQYFESQASSSDQLVQMFNFWTLTCRKLPPQVLYESGIFSTFFHGSKIPEFLSYKSVTSDFILSITLPPYSHNDDPNCKIRGLNACVVYSSHRGSDMGPPHIASFIQVCNRTKGLIWGYRPMTIGVPEENGDMLWLSHWLFGDEDLEIGDTIRVTTDLPWPLFIKEFGIQIVYGEHEHDKGIRIQFQPETIPSTNVNSNSVSASPQYQLKPGNYLICHHWILRTLYDIRSLLSSSCHRLFDRHGIMFPTVDVDIPIGPETIPTSSSSSSWNINERFQFQHHHSMNPSQSRHLKKIIQLDQKPFRFLTQATIGGFGEINPQL